MITDFLEDDAFPSPVEADTRPPVDDMSTRQMVGYLMIVWRDGHLPLRCRVRWLAAIAGTAVSR